jgi:hypothetical protein
MFLMGAGATGCIVSPIIDDLTHPVIKRALWNLSGSDRTLRESSLVIEERGFHLSLVI